MSFAHAASILPALEQGMPYETAKKLLIADGWTPSKNTKISQSSLYAQELYEQGMTEVVDCVSMELDGCRFYFVKKNQTLEVKTITRRLRLDKFSLVKKP